MNIGGMDGGDGRWNSADSFVQYRITHDGDAQGGGSTPRGNSLAGRPYLQLFLLCFGIGLFEMMGSGLNFWLAILLPAAIGGTFVLLFAGIVALVRRIRR